MENNKQKKSLIVKPFTGKQTDVWPIGQLLSTFEWYKAYYKQVDEKSIRDAAHAKADEVLAVWTKAHVPTSLRKHVDNVENIFKELAKLTKNK